MHQVHHADQVDVDGVDERLRRNALGQRSDAGVGHHDVELAELGHAASIAADRAARSRTSAISV